MASKDSTSNKLFSNYKASKLGGYYRNGGESSRYVVGSVGKSSGKRIKFSPETMRSNQNVAIATQVLNPSAIGGPFKNRGFGEHFGPKEDDQISFLSHKSRALCSKVFFYGVSIGAMVLMVSGLIIGVSYMQTEKERIVTRPARLSQGLHFAFISTTTPSNDPLQGTTTTVKPQSYLNDNEIEEEDDIDEISLDDYHKEHQSKPSQSQTQTFGFDGSNTVKEQEHQNDLDEDNSEKNSNNGQEYEELEEADEEEESNNAEENSNSADKHFSGIKIQPPPVSKFEGISFGIPIYRTNSSVIRNHEPLFPTPNYNYQKNELRENETEIESSSTSVDPEFLESETEAETNIKHSIYKSGANFTSQDDNEREEALFADSDERKNYANANNSSSLLSVSVFSQDKEDDLFDPEAQSSQSQLNNESSNQILKASSRFAKKENDNEDFAIGEATTSVVSLQTDLFDNEEDQDVVETSASDDGINDSPAEHKIEEISDDYPSTNKPRAKNNNRAQGNPQRSRQGKLLRGESELDAVPSPHANGNKKYQKSGKRIRIKGQSGRKNGKGRQDKPRIVDGAEDDEEQVNLNYKIDFSQYIPSTSTTPKPLSSNRPTSIQDNIEYQPPTFSTPSPYPDFIFSPSPTTDYDKPFDLDEYLKKHANKQRANPAPEQQQPSLDIATYVQAQLSKNPQGDSTNYAQIQGIPEFKPNPSALTGNYNSQSQSLSPESSENQLTKRTFYNFDNYGSSGANNANNPFAHLLGPKAATNNFGVPSPTGATFNLFPQTSYDFSPSSHSPTNSFDALKNFGYDLSNANPADLPYPNLIPPTGGDNSNIGSNYQNTFSFSNSNPVDSSQQKHILTTGSGHVPTYNTITQGIHLLSLLSGKVPPSSYQDHLSSGSSHYSASTESPYNTNPYGSSSGNQFSSVIRSSNPYGQNHGQGSASFDFFPNKSFRTSASTFSDGDQDSSASSNFPSFSKSILEKISNHDVERSVKNYVPSTQNPNSEYETLSLSNANGMEGNVEDFDDNIASESVLHPKSISISILPKMKPLSGISRSSSSSSYTPTTSSEIEAILLPRPRKKLLPALSVSNLELAGSASGKVETIVPAPPSLPKKGGRREGKAGSESGRGLKSGFFT